ncbi:hypothetical protein BaRGS_00035812 [Batillaria attramentaria]|uniref:Uncharacterized protein n=1 Tax=Batillaria attramentaria TaxID=370345 RepID=A0ABD0JDD1_9CAEN
MRFCFEKSIHTPAVSHNEESIASPGTTTSQKPLEMAAHELRSCGENLIKDVSRSFLFRVAEEPSEAKQENTTVREDNYGAVGVELRC